MSEQQVKAGQVDEAEKVLDVVFPSSDESAEVVQPSKEPLHFPAFPITAQLAAILSSAFTSAPIRGNQFDPVLVFERSIERVRIVGLVANERAGSSSRKLPAKTASTSWHSAGEALSTDTARGRLLSATTAMILVPLPRRVRWPHPRRLQATSKTLAGSRRACWNLAVAIANCLSQFDAKRVVTLSRGQIGVSRQLIQEPGESRALHSGRKLTSDNGYVG
jgi:hypothetical protein